MEKQGDGTKRFLRYIREQLQQKESLYAYHSRKRKEETKLLQENLSRLQQLQEAQTIFQNIAQQIQNQIHLQISTTVTQCLNSVFPELRGRFSLEFLGKRGKTEALFRFYKDNEMVDLLTASGGGLVDVVTFALRLSCLLLSAPAKRRLLVLDEPFRFVSKEYQPRLQNLLQRLAKDLEVQILMITHSELLACGKVIDLSPGK